MKKIIIPCILLCFALAFTGCSSSSPPVAETTTYSDNISRTTYNVGNFTVDIPEGWTAYPQEDVLAETTAQGQKSPNDPDYICISDSETTEMGLYNLPYLSIRRYEKDEEVPSARSWFNNVQDLELAIQGTQCTEAIIGESQIEQDTTYEHILWETDKGSFVIEFPTVKNGIETGYSHNDEKIKIILETINNPSQKQ